MPAAPEHPTLRGDFGLHCWMSRLDLDYFPLSTSWWAAENCSRCFYSEIVPEPRPTHTLYYPRYHYRNMILSTCCFSQIPTKTCSLNYIHYLSCPNCLYPARWTPQWYPPRGLYCARDSLRSHISPFCAFKVIWTIFAPNTAAVRASGLTWKSLESWRLRGHLLRFQHPWPPPKASWQNEIQAWCMCWLWMS